jgi:hypothetical protein
VNDVAPLTAERRAADALRHHTHRTVAIENGGALFSTVTVPPSPPPPPPTLDAAPPGRWTVFETVTGIAAATANALRHDAGRAPSVIILLLFAASTFRLSTASGATDLALHTVAAGDVARQRKPPLPPPPPTDWAMMPIELASNVWMTPCS